MLLFIIIFFAMVIVVGAAMVAGFSLYLKRRRQSLGANNPKQFAEPPVYRSLFEPDAAELRAAKLEEKSSAQAKQTAAAQKAIFERTEKLREFKQVWRSEPNRQNTVELLRLASTSESAEIFSQTAESVIQVLLREQTGIFTANDLAELLDSHLKLLPQQERFSGAAFLIKQEIERLRGKSE